MSIGSADSASVSLSIGGHGFTFTTSCGLLTPNKQGLRIVGTSSPTTHDYPCTGLVSSPVPAVWTCPTMAGFPAGWTGATCLVRTRCTGAQYYNDGSAGSFASTVTCTNYGLFKTGDTSIAVYVQYNGPGTSTGLQTPTISSGWSLVFSDSTKRVFVWIRPNGVSGAAPVITGVNAASCQQMYFAVTRTYPGASAQNYLGKMTQPAATALSSGNCILTGNPSTVYAFFNQHRGAAGSAAIAPFTSPTSPFVIQRTWQQSIFDSASGFFFKLTSQYLPTTPQPAGTYHCSVTSGVSVEWDSGIFAIHH